MFGLPSGMDGYLDHACAGSDALTMSVIIHYDCPPRLRAELEEGNSSTFWRFFERPSYYGTTPASRRCVRALIHEHQHWFQLISNG